MQHPAASGPSIRHFAPEHTCSTHAAGKEGWVRPSGDLKEAVVEDAGEQAMSEVLPELCSSDSSASKHREEPHESLAEDELHAMWQTLLLQWHDGARAKPVTHGKVLILGRWTHVEQDCCNDNSNACST